MAATAPPTAAPERFARTARRASRRAALVAGALVGLGAIGGVAVWRLTQPVATTAALPTAVLQKPALAVLPIVNATGDPGREALSAQIDAEVRNGLGGLSGLATSPMSTVLPYHTRSVSVSQAARELNVRYILDGTMKIVDGKPTIVASLVDTATGTTLWTERFDAASASAVERDVLMRTIAALPITLTADEQATLSGTPKTAAPSARPPSSPAPAATRPSPPRQAAPVAKPPLVAPFVETQPKPPTGADALKPGAARRDNGSRVTPPPSSSPAREQAPPAAPMPHRPAPAEREVPQQGV